MQLPTVFISYIHDNDEHRDQVRKFARLLGDRRIHSENDFWLDPVRRDLGKWAERCIKNTDYTLVIASPRYRLVGNGEVSDDENEGGQWEVSILRDMLQRARSKWTKRILPVVLPGRTKAEIPDFLQPWGVTHYPVPTLDDEGIEELYRTLTLQPEHVRPELGPPLELPPKSGPGSPGWASGNRP
ncbi:hypothetical protein FHR84_000532 [Actinopolyspora biskrensis]|uniref:SEFIR domain-containing protein n=1 Tax=Actinopolyspora biskrensis TaxID=1470178 RepID=A0A852YTE9_9ACTN|nr:hypothetical protein [Actinopolyspora biskrensis]